MHTMPPRKSPTDKTAKPAIDKAVEIEEDETLESFQQMKANDGPCHQE